MIESSRLSVSIWRMMRVRLAPSAVRIATSFSREAARARRRFATFAQAISRTSATAPSSTSKEGRTDLTRRSCRSDRFASQPVLVSACAFASCALIVLTCVCACCSGTPGLRRPITEKERLSRGSSCGSIGELYQTCVASGKSKPGGMIPTTVPGSQISPRSKRDSAAPCKAAAG